jgi:hypothetical protein
MLGQLVTVAATVVGWQRRAGGGILPPATAASCRLAIAASPSALAQ